MASIFHTTINSNWLTITPCHSTVPQLSLPCPPLVTHFSLTCHLPVIHMSLMCTLPVCHMSLVDWSAVTSSHFLVTHPCIKSRPIMMYMINNSFLNLINKIEQKRYPFSTPQTTIYNLYLWYWMSLTCHFSSQFGLDVSLRFQNHYNYKSINFNYKTTNAIFTNWLMDKLIIIDNIDNYTTFKKI